MIVYIIFAKLCCEWQFLILFCFKFNVMKVSLYPINNQNAIYTKSKNKIQKNNNHNTTQNSIIYPKNYYLSFNGAKKINFEKAHSVIQAEDYGKRILDVALYEDFEKESLDVINYINEGFTQVKNSTRKAPRIPRYIRLGDDSYFQMSVCFFGGGQLIVNQNIYDTKKLSLEIERIFNELKKDKVIKEENGKFSLNEDFSNPKLDILLLEAGEKKAQLASLSYDEKIDLYNKIRVIYEQTSQLNRFPKQLIVKMLEAGCWGEFKSDDVELFSQILFSKRQDENFSTLYEFLKEYNSLNFDIKDNSFKHKTLFHEIGHLQDFDIFYYLPSIDQYRDSKEYPKKMNDWLNDKEAMKAAFEVSPYACYGAPEFVAESYSWLLEGKKLPPKAQELYDKLNAPKVCLRQN